MINIFLIIILLAVASIIASLFLFKQRRTLLLMIRNISMLSLVAMITLGVLYYNSDHKRFNSAIDAFSHLNKDAVVLKEMDSGIDATVLYSEKDATSISFIEKNEKGWMTDHGIFISDTCKLYALGKGLTAYIKKFKNSDLYFIGIDSPIPQDENEKKYFSDINSVSDSAGNSYWNFHYVNKQVNFTFYYTFASVNPADFAFIINGTRYPTK